MMSKIVKIEFIIFFLLSQAIQAQTIVNITSADAKPILEKSHYDNFVIIDGRSSNMFSKGYIKDAINIDAFNEQAPKLLAQHIQKDSILVYCTNCNRTNKINELLKESGYKGTIINMTDGITGWKNNNYEISKPEETLALELQGKTNEKTTKLNPIVQVFGTAAYDIENNWYGYSFGRAHLGFQYQFNESWSANDN